MSQCACIQFINSDGLILENDDDDDEDAMIVGHDETGEQDPLAHFFFKNIFFCI